MSVLRGTRALITGGTRGIGRAIAEVLARSGAELALNFVRDEDAARRAADEIARSSGVRVVLVRGNVGDPEQARAVVERAAAVLGGLSLLVNNAGPFALGSLADTSPAEFRALLDANLSSVHACTHAALPHLRRAPRAAIVNVGLSTTGETVRGAAHVGAYAIAKTGLAVYTKTLAAELAPESIAVVCVAPGLTDNGHLDETQRRWMEERCPSGRLVGATDVAEVVAFAAGSQALALSGAVIGVAGGWEWAHDRSPASDGAHVLDHFRAEAPR